MNSWETATTKTTTNGPLLFWSEEIIERIWFTVVARKTHISSVWLQTDALSF